MFISRSGEPGNEAIGGGQSINTPLDIILSKFFKLAVLSLSIQLQQKDSSKKSKAQSKHTNTGLFLCTSALYCDETTNASVNSCLSQNKNLPENHWSLISQPQHTHKHLRPPSQQNVAKIKLAHTRHYLDISLLKYQERYPTQRTPFLQESKWQQRSRLEQKTSLPVITGVNLGVHRRFQTRKSVK